MSNWLDRNWKVICGYFVLGAVLGAIELYRGDTSLVIWSGRYPFKAGDQEAFDQVERQHGGAVNRASTLYRPAGDQLELVSQLRIVPAEQTR